MNQLNMEQGRIPNMKYGKPRMVSLNNTYPIYIFESNNYMKPLFYIQTIKNGEPVLEIFLKGKFISMEELKEILLKA